MGPSVLNCFPACGVCLNWQACLLNCDFPAGIPRWAFNQPSAVIEVISCYCKAAVKVIV